MVAIVLLAGVGMVGVADVQAQTNRSGTSTYLIGDTTLSSTSTDTSTGTSSGTSTGSGTTTPGVPNTGLGGSAATNFAILLATGALILGGATLVANRMATRG